MRRIIKRDRRLPGIGLQVPHAKCYALAKASLVDIVDARELSVDLAKLPDHVTVIHGPRAELAAGAPAAQSHAWRAIFHARVHQELEQRLADGRLTASAIRERINRIGQTEFDEIRFVLKQEELLLPPHPDDKVAGEDTGTYIEFAALYLELAHFCAAHRHAHVPGAPRSRSRRRHDRARPRCHRVARRCASRARARRAAARDVDGAGGGGVEGADPAIIAKLRVPSAIPAAAATARQKGNRARAAMLSFRGGEPTTARGDLDALVERLATALGNPATAGWADALAPVAQFAAGQRVLRFTAGARLLHDLQTACVVAEREVKVVDTVTWALSLGKRPIVRALPASREVRIAKHLHAASAKDPRGRVGLRRGARAARERRARDGRARRSQRARDAAAEDRGRARRSESVAAQPARARRAEEDRRRIARSSGRRRPLVDRQLARRPVAQRSQDSRSARPRARARRPVAALPIMRCRSRSTASIAAARRTCAFCRSCRRCCSAHRSAACSACTSCCP